MIDQLTTGGGAQPTHGSFNTLGYSDSKSLINLRDVKDDPQCDPAGRDRPILKSVLDAGDAHCGNWSKSPCPNLMATPSISLSVYQSARKKNQEGRTKQYSFIGIGANHLTEDHSENCIKLKNT